MTESAKDFILFITFGCALVAMFGYAGSSDAQEAEMQMNEYCVMEKLYKDTNGDAGWPTKECEK